MRWLFQKTLGSIVLSLCLLWSPPSFSSEIPKFSPDFGARLQRNLDTYLHDKHLDQPPDRIFQMAKIDLNHDSINEILVRPSSCHNAGTCTIMVFADQKDRLILLGEIPARHVILGHEYTHGVRHILAFQNNANDFDYALYVWEPERTQYMLWE